MPCRYLHIPIYTVLFARILPSPKIVFMTRCEPMCVYICINSIYYIIYIPSNIFGSTKRNNNLCNWNLSWNGLLSFIRMKTFDFRLNVYFKASTIVLIGILFSSEYYNIVYRELMLLLLLPFTGKSDESNALTQYQSICLIIWPIYQWGTLYYYYYYTFEPTLEK